MEQQPGRRCSRCCFHRCSHLVHAQTYHGRVSDFFIGLPLVAAAYLAGSFPTASIIGLMSGHDHSREGSGNPGASNVWRTSGARYGLLTVVIDALKGFLPVLITMLVIDRPWASVVWVAATVGHCFPLGRLRSGGKGMATGGGGSLPLYPLLGAALIVLFTLIVRLTKVAALGSLIVTACLVLGVVALHESKVEIVSAVAVAAVIIGRHRSNIGRIVSGKELHV